MPISLVVLSLFQLSVARVDSCPPTPATGRAPAWFEFQVDRPARWSGSDSTLPYPDTSLAGRDLFFEDLALVQFIVDTAGVPVSQSLRVLRRPDSLTVATVRASLSRWRYEPAIALTCKVPQLVQTSLRWR